MNTMITQRNALMIFSTQLNKYLMTILRGIYLNHLPLNDIEEPKYTNIKLFWQKKGLNTQVAFALFHITSP